MTSRFESRREARAYRPLRRVAGNREPRRVFQVLVEGAKTEPIYIEALRKLPEVKDNNEIDIKIVPFSHSDREYAMGCRRRHAFVKLNTEHTLPLLAHHQMVIFGHSEVKKASMALFWNE